MNVKITINVSSVNLFLKKRKGENIDQSLVDKTYHLENKEESKRLQEVVKEIPYM